MYLRLVFFFDYFLAHRHRRAENKQSNHRPNRDFTCNLIRQCCCLLVPQRLFRLTWWKFACCLHSSDHLWHPSTQRTAGRFYFWLSHFTLTNIRSTLTFPPKTKIFRCQLRNKLIHHHYHCCVGHSLELCSLKAKDTWEWLASTVWVKHDFTSKKK